MARGAPDAFHLWVARKHLRHNLVDILREHGGRRHMAGETASALVGRWIGLEPDAQYCAEDRRLQRRPVQQRGIDPAERFEIRRLFARAFPLLIVSIMALLAVFRSNEDLFNFSHPVARCLRFLRDGAGITQTGDTHNEHKEQANDDSWYGPSAS